MRCILAEISIVFHHHHPELRVLRYLLDVAVPPETPGLMGQVESISATTCRLLETGAGSKPRTRPGTKEERNEEYAPSHAEPEQEATTIKRKGATGRQPREHAENPKAEEHLTPLADLPRHHPVEAEVEAEAPEIVQNHPVVPSVMPGSPQRVQIRLHRSKREAGYRIEDYYNAVTFAGGTPNIACRMLQLYLIGPARVWLSDLEENTIFCWLDLKKAFENHFRGTYKRPATTSDLQACIQKKGETSRSFLIRWLATRNECENVDNRTAMHAFIGGLQRGGLLRHKLTCLVNANKLTLDEMINIASDHLAADDDAAEISQLAIPLHQQEKP
ncbi:hypothetical protein QYE76_022334 [Lolium multiflorum]|uniref:Retrotransposon gag domain-containing protein n=1 Tax=Lolium multiflorum TaxID=4521 RepID=A0AAD8VR36_LOLMU|nr:hypothetical protein QYE76_022334 [Lolium multiflorum]